MDQSVQRFVTVLTNRSSNLCEGQRFSPLHNLSDSPWSHPHSHKMGTKVIFLGESGQAVVWTTIAHLAVPILQTPFVSPLLVVGKPLPLPSPVPSQRLPVILRGPRYLKYNRVAERVFFYSKKARGDFTRNTRSQRPHSLRRGSAAAPLLGLRFRIPPGAWMSSFVIVVCCQIEVSSSGRSLIQRSPTDCGVSECDCGTSQRRSGPSRALKT